MRISVKAVPQVMGFMFFGQCIGFHFPEDASHLERLTGTEMANTEIGVPGGC